MADHLPIPAARTPTKVRRPREFVSSLLASIPAPPPQPRSPSLSSSANPLKDEIPGAKQLFLTLHVLFPNELLPALDVLDRGLVMRLRTAPVLPLSDAGADPRPPEMFLVRSAQQQQQQQHHHHHATSQHFRNNEPAHIAAYEVRLEAWSCSCPAFIFSAFPSHRSSTLESDYDDDDDDDGETTTAANVPFARAQPSSERDPSTAAAAAAAGTGFRFGGRTRGGAMPVCKHVLACVLVQHCAAFAHLVEDREVPADEMAGWAAGWGD